MQNLMEYNSSRIKLVIPEYGRNIQEMVAKLFQIEDKTKRTYAAYYVIGVMEQMNPQVKDTEDYLHKLWDHMHIISEYKLDVDSPYPPPLKENLQRKPRHIGYTSEKIHDGHYGSLIPKLIRKALDLENGEEKQAFALSIANQMKRLYLTWNRETVNDTIIIKDLEKLSGGRLLLSEDTRLISASDIVTKTSNQQLSNSKKKKPNQKPNQPYQKRRK